jgi:hypothetical protein
MKKKKPLEKKSLPTSILSLPTSQPTVRNHCQLNGHKQVFKISKYSRWREKKLDIGEKKKHCHAMPMVKNHP